MRKLYQYVLHQIKNDLSRIDPEIANTKLLDATVDMICLFHVASGRASSHIGLLLSLSRPNSLPIVEPFNLSDGQDSRFHVFSS